MKHEISSESIKIINVDSTGKKLESGYRPEYFIHLLEQKDEDKGLDPNATKYAIFIAAQESRRYHVFRALKDRQITTEFAQTEISDANHQIGLVWENVSDRASIILGMPTYLNSALSVLREHGSIAASEDTFHTLFEWAQNKIADKTSLRTALLEQDKKSKELRENNDIQLDFYRRTVVQIFEQGDRDQIRKSLNNLVSVANRQVGPDLKFYIYDALNEYYHEHIKNNDSIDPYVAYHTSSILGPEPFVTGGGVPVINGQLANCTDFDFILDLRRQRIAQLQKRS